MTLDLEAIKARAEAATPGPWEPLSPCSNSKSPTGREPFDSTSTAGLGFDVEGPERPMLDRYRFESGHDAVFIAHARADVPALVAEVERLRGEVETREHAYDELKSDADAEVGVLREEVERLRAELATATRPIFIPASPRTIGSGW